MTFSKGTEWVRGQRASHQHSGACTSHYLRLFVYWLICFCNDLHFSSTVTSAQPENIPLCSAQAEVEHLHTASSSSSHMVHLAPKITLTIVVVHHCQHFLLYFNSDFSVNATIKHSQSKKCFSIQIDQRVLPFLWLFLLQPVGQNLFKETISNSFFIS